MSLNFLCATALDPLANSRPPEQYLPQINFAWEFLKMIMVLLAICAFAYFLLRWFVPKLNPALRDTNAMIRVVYRFALEPRKHLYIIRVGDDYHLIATSDNSVNYLSALETEKVEEALGQMQIPTFPGQKSFLKILQNNFDLPGAAAKDLADKDK